MSLTQIFKKVLIPCAAGVTNATANSEGHTFGPNCAKKAEAGTKPSDLPIYSKDCVICREANQTPPPPSGMEETVGNIRRELWVWQDNLKGYRHKIVDVYRRGFSKVDCPEKTKARNHLENSLGEDKASQAAAKKRPASSVTPKFEKLCLDRCGRPCSGEHKHNSQCQHKSKPVASQRPLATQQSKPCQPPNKPPPCEGRKTCPRNSEAVVEYLREPPHGPHRIGAIAISGLTGFILGMRKGRIRKVLYGTFGMLGMAAVCYPEEAKDCLESVVLEGRRYFIVAYHFICGETPQVPEWLEKYIGPLGVKEGEGATNETNLDSKKAILKEETKPTKEKKT